MLKCWCGQVFQSSQWQVSQINLNSTPNYYYWGWWCAELCEYLHLFDTDPLWSHSTFTIVVVIIIIFLLKYDLDSRQSCPAHSLSVNVWMNPHVCANIAAISSFLSDKMRHQPVFMTFVHIATCTVIQQLSYSHFKKPFFFSFHCKWLFVDFNVYCCCIATMYLCKKI